MSTVPEAAVLATINDAVEKLQRSTRTTAPMFAIGIIATVVAAAIAVYYILTLSANLRDANRRLQQSQSTVSEMQAKLSAVNHSLQQAQQTVTSPVAQQTIANAISDVSNSQKTLTSVSSSISEATATIAPEVAQAPIGRCQVEVGGVAYISGPCEIQMQRGGSFQVWTVGRTGASASVVRQDAYGIGSWQAAPGQAAVNVGTLQRRGACWFNTNAQICAWK